MEIVSPAAAAATTAARMTDPRASFQFLFELAYASFTCENLIHHIGEYGFILQVFAFDEVS